MVIVLFDCVLPKIKEFFCVNSILEMKLFSEIYGERYLKKLWSLNPKEIVCCFDYEDVPSVLPTMDLKVVSGIDKLKKYIESSSDNDYLLVFSERYFEADISTFTDSTSWKYGVFFHNDTLTSVLLKKSAFLHFLSAFFISNEKNIVSEYKKFEICGYCKFIETPRDYKSFLDDILKGETEIKLPELAQNIFAYDSIPRGDFVIIPPVYISDNVQIESGCIIGPGTVIGSDTLIAKNSHIRNTILGSGTYISRDCFIDGALLDENVTIRRNSSVFSGTLLGNGSTVGESCVIENGSYIKPNARIDEIKSKYVNYMVGAKDSPAGFYGYLPEKAALLGAAIGTAFSSSKIAFAGDGEPNSTSLKLALLSGAMTTGVECYEFGNSFMSSLFYYMSFCGLECAVFISGNKNGTVITVFTPSNISLSNSQYYEIKNVMTLGEIKRCKADECKHIRQIHGMQRMYIQNLIRNFSDKVNILLVFKSENKYIESVAELAAAKIRAAETSLKERIVFHVNAEGTRVTAESNGEKYNHNELEELCFYFSNKNNRKANDKFENLWEFDAVSLSFKIVEFLNEYNLTLAEAVERLPDFYVAENDLSDSVSFFKVASELCNRGSLRFADGALQIDTMDSAVSVDKKDDGKLRLKVKAASREFAEELSGELLQILNESNHHKS